MPRYPRPWTLKMLEKNVYGLCQSTYNRLLGCIPHLVKQPRDSHILSFHHVLLCYRSYIKNRFLRGLAVSTEIINFG